MPGNNNKDVAHADETKTKAAGSSSQVSADNQDAGEPAIKPRKRLPDSRPPLSAERLAKAKADAEAKAQELAAARRAAKAQGGQGLAPAPVPAPAPAAASTSNAAANKDDWTNEEKVKLLLCRVCISKGSSLAEAAPKLLPHRPIDECARVLAELGTQHRFDDLV
ncbi:hypothetical protein N656DRAFT_770495 [Canariomyces notabilis]|uniref:Uncharacterized protein n=1 Tax=Canariomyces notabilis TaxID=2074819 RepID=A0AAN6QH28_9PEZI|nr:hypothetical protein N656DRAFT_770495 [Canariomyces arenarius]